MPSLNRSRRTVAKNVGSGYLTLALSTLLGLVTTPVLLDQLGQEGYGVWILIVSTIAYVGLLEVGIGTSTTIRVAAIEEKGSAAVSAVLSASRALYALIVVVQTFAVVGLAVIFPSLFQLPPQASGPVFLSVLLVGIGQSIGFLTNTLAAALIGTGRQYVLTLSGFAIGTLTTVAQLIVVTLRGGLVALSACLLGGAVAALLVQGWQVRRRLPGTSIRMRGARRSDMSRLLQLGWRNSSMAILGTFAFGSDVLLVGLLLGPAAAAAYAVAHKAFMLVRTLSTKVIDVLTPTYANAKEALGQAEQFRIYTDSVTAGWLLAIPGAVGVGFFAEPLLDLWLARPPSQSWVVLTLLCCLLAVQMPGHAAYVLIRSHEELDLLLKVVAVSAILNVSLSIGLISIVGIIGPAASSLLVVLIVDAWVLPSAVCRLLGQERRTYVSAVLMPVLPGLAACLSTAALLRLAWDPSGLAVLPACLLVSLTYWAAWWRWGAHGDHQKQARALTNRLLSRGAA